MSATKLTIDHITLQHIQDDSGLGPKDLGCFYTEEEYLRQGETAEDAKQHAEDDADRLESYYHSYWTYIGIRAKATVSYDIGQGSRRIETFTSGGLWGIESDGGEEYFAEVEKEELASLREHLRVFGVNLSNFDEKVNDAERKTL